MLRYKYLTQEPLDAHAFKTEPLVEDNLNYQRYLQLEAARIDWLLNCNQSQVASIITVADLQQNLEVEAREAICKCLAFKNEEQTALTTNALRYWRMFVWRKAIPEATFPIPNFLTGGQIGSIASFTAVYPQTIWPTTPKEVVYKLLELVWAELNLNLATAPGQRLEFLVRDLKFDRQYIKQSALSLSKIALNDLNFRKYALDESSLKDLPLRLLLGEVSDSLISAWARFQIDCNQNLQKAVRYNMPVDSYQKPFHLLQVGLTVGRGGGWLLLFQAIYIEALLAISKELDLLSGELTNLVLDPATDLARGKIALYYALAADAQSVLGFFDTIEGANLKAESLWEQAQRWQATRNSEPLDNNDWRLTSFIKSLLHAFN